MEIETGISELAGEWTGINRLWLTPDDPARESETKASVERAAKEQPVAGRR